MNKLTQMNNELYKLFDIFNKKYFNGLLETPILTIQTNSNNQKTMGWFTTRKIWKDHEDKKLYYEINVSAEFLYRGVEGICSTLLHEMTHLYCKQNDIKEVSRGNTYHNKKFKEEAEKRGLIITYSKSIGWSTSELTDEARAYIKEIEEENKFCLTRINHKKGNETEEPGADEEEEEPGENEKKKSSQRKYICPVCKTIVRATKEVNIICGDCKCEFELEEND